MIDISQPGWQNKLKEIQRKLEGEGAANDPHKGIDRIMVFDHNGTYHNKATKKPEASHEFGSTIDPVTKQRVNRHLTPDSPEWKTVTSSIKPKGDIVLTGCETAKQGMDETKNPPVPIPGGDGPSYVEYLHLDADKTRTPTVHAYSRNVRHRTYLNRLSLTAGSQHSRSTEGYQVIGP